jgi:SAM-dependent methyltransferase
MCGNKQVKNGTVLEWENKPSKKLFQNDFLLNQLFEMTQSNPKAELPSCNTFIKPTLKVEYPNKASAEDHWFFVYLLMQKDNLNILIDDELLYCFYSLDGMVTHSNKKSKDFFCSRKELYFFFKKEIYIDIIKRKWKDQITIEGLSFHQSNIKINKHKLEKYWSLTYPVNRRIENEISKLNIKQIKLLDVGCGPFPKSGIYHKDYEIQRVLVDTLATSFHSLLNENDICTNGQNIIIGNAEEIQSEIFECLFDIIYAKNTLDHSYNPIKAISNLSELLSGHGVIILEHYIKEGEYTEYFGLHQWNFYIENNNFMISSRDKIIVQNINNLYPLLEVNSFYDENKIINLIYKRKC